MSNSVLFLFFVTIGSGLIFAAGGFAGGRARRLYKDWPAAERDTLRIALELSLFTMLLALLPLLLAATMIDAETLWVLSSVMFTVFLAAQLARVMDKMREHGVRWPVVSGLLLVLSVFLLTIEVINVLWWRAGIAYAAGLVWLLLLAGVQTIAFICYERLPTVDNDINDIHPTHAYEPGYHGIMGQRLRRHHHTNYTHRPPDSSTNRYRDPVQYARSQRHLNRSRSRR